MSMSTEITISIGTDTYSVNLGSRQYAYDWEVTQIGRAGAKHIRGKDAFDMLQFPSFTKYFSYTQRAIILLLISEMESLESAATYPGDERDYSMYGITITLYD